MTRGIPRDLTFFESRTRKTASGCWEWTGYSTRAGHGRGGLYGRTSRRGEKQPISSHTLAYEVFKGPVPSGLEIDHTCRNTICCNPDHLEAVTASENNRRKWAAGDGANQNTGKRACPTHGTPYDMESKRGDGRTFRSCRACYRDYQREYQRGVRARRKAKRETP